jgi:hypothetical protein
MKSYLFLLRVSSFIGRAVVFFFVTSLFLLFFYLVGNYQGFLDSTQLFLLAALNVSLVLHLVLAAYFTLLLFVRMAKERRLIILRFLLVTASMVFSAGLLTSMRFLQSWLRS